MNTGSSSELRKARTTTFILRALLWFHILSMAETVWIAIVWIVVITLVEKALIHFDG